MTRRYILTRDVLHAVPDGNSVRRTESIEVEIAWPDDEPEGTIEPPRMSYVTHGDWRISSLARKEADCG